MGQIKLLIFLALLLKCQALEASFTDCEKKYLYKQVCVIYNVDSPSCFYGQSTDCKVLNRIFDSICPIWTCKVKITFSLIFKINVTAALISNYCFRMFTLMINLTNNPLRKLQLLFLKPQNQKVIIL